MRVVVFGAMVAYHDDVLREGLVPPGVLPPVPPLLAEDAGVTHLTTRQTDAGVSQHTDRQTDRQPICAKRRGTGVVRLQA
jgi:hypothetical protein